MHLALQVHSLLLALSIMAFSTVAIAQHDLENVVSSSDYGLMEPLDLDVDLDSDLVAPEPAVANEVDLNATVDVCGCAKLNELAKAAAGAYKGVYYDNNFDYLCDPCYDEWHLGENFKRLAVGDCWTLDLGGEFRLRQQNETNIRTKPLSGGDDNFLLQRTRLYLNAEYSDWFRFYGEAVDATSYWEDFSPRTIEVNRLDSLNLFADLKLWDNGTDADLWGRAGRQELLYGAQRLVSPLDWSNVRRTFDGAKFMYDDTDWRIDGWWTRPVLFGQHVAGGSVDHNWDHSEDDQDFTGIWATQEVSPGRALDLYYLRLADYSGTLVDANANAGDADFNMFGARFLGKRNDWLWEAQGGYQFGDFGDDNISAGFFTLGMGRTIESHCWKPTLWAYYDWASGDKDPTDSTHGTFNQYFPLSHKYLGFMDIIGRQNVEDINFLFTLQPTEKVKLLAWYHIFHLQSDTDALYNAAGAPIYQDPTGGSGGDIGQELDLLVDWSITPRINMLFGYSHFWVGDYFESSVIQTAGTPPNGIATNGADGQGADFYYTQFSVRF